MAKELKGIIPFYTSSSEWEEQGIVKLANNIISQPWFCGWVDYKGQVKTFENNKHSPVYAYLYYKTDSTLEIELQLSWQEKYKTFGAKLCTHTNPYYDKSRPFCSKTY